MQLSIRDPKEFVAATLNRLADYLEARPGALSEEEIARDLRYCAEVLNGRTTLPGGENGENGQ